MSKSVGLAETFPIINRQFGGDKRWRPVQTIVCSRCGVEDIQAATGGGRVPEHVIATRFRTKGWRVEDRKDRHLCPACIAAVEAEKPKKKEAAVAVEPDRSPAAKARLGDLYMMLADAYQPSTKTYRDGWSDDRIASECELSVEFVRQRREQDFGPLAPPDRTVEELARMTKEATILIGQLAQETARHQAFVAERTTAINSALTMLGELSQRLSDAKAVSGARK